MVDRVSRDKLAASLQRFLDGSATADDAFGLGNTTSIDPAISSIEDRSQFLITRLYQFRGEDCGNWECCACDCDKCSLINPKSDSAKGAFFKRSISRMVAFLKTDREYIWADSIPWWILLPAFVVILIFTIIYFFNIKKLYTLVAKIGIKEEIGTWLSFIPLIFAILLLMIKDRVLNRIGGKDQRYWPFRNREEYEAETGSQISPRQR